MVSTPQPVDRIHADVIEKFVQSKTGRIEDCEDLIHISKNYVAVLDGTTDKTDLEWDGKTSGQVAARIIDRTLNKIPADYSAYQAIDILTHAINGFYKQINILETVEVAPQKRISAALAVISLARQEIWLVGDCQFIVGDQKFSNPLKTDSILANVRALCLELELAKGSTIDMLATRDVGRKFIMPLLEQQSLFQNNVNSGEYSYFAVDGFPIDQSGILVQRIPRDINTLVLATDGYPILRESLHESESELEQILLRDPLLFRDYKRTKGLIKGNVSFDDRAFVKVRIERRMASAAG